MTPATLVQKIIRRIAGVALSWPITEPVHFLRGRWKPPIWLLPSLVPRQEFEVKLAGGRSFRMYPASSVEQHLYWYGLGETWEAQSLRIWSKLCEVSSVVYDIGANTGAYALVASTINPAATVVAFEPIARISRLLSANVKLNNAKIIVEMLAISDRDGSAEMYDPIEVDIPYSASLSDNFYRSIGSSSTTTVTTMSVDSYVGARKMPSPDLIKIDVEGHENNVLNGLEMILTVSSPAVLFEILPEKKTKEEIAEIDNLSKCHGYEIYCSDNELEFARVDSVGEVSGSKICNVLLVKRSSGHWRKLEPFFAGDTLRIP